MLVMNTCSRVLSWTNQSTKKTKTVSTTLMVASCLPIFSIFWRRGGGSTSMAWTMPAILPNWLLIPVSVMTATARPLVTTVPMNTMHFWSPTPASAATGSSLFETGLDSPVSAASSTSRLAASMSLPSAGTLLPASSSTMSPGTRSMESMDSSLPSLRTKTLGLTMALRASTAFSARYSCTKPRTAFMTTMKSITMASVMGSPSCMARWAETAADIMSMMTSMLVNCSKRMWYHFVFASSLSSLAPYSSSLLPASSSVMPSRLVSSASRTSSTSLACQSMFSKHHTMPHIYRGSLSPMGRYYDLKLLR